MHEIFALQIAIQSVQKERKRAKLIDRVEELREAEDELISLKSWLIKLHVNRMAWARDQLEEDGLWPGSESQNENA